MTTKPTPARASVLTARARARIEAEVAKAPPLTTTQRDKLAELLRPVRIGGAA